MKAGERYRHYKGSEYEILEPEALDEATKEELVVYKNVEGGPKWITTVERFNSVVETEAGLLKRFVKLD